MGLQYNISNVVLSSNQITNIVNTFLFSTKHSSIFLESDLTFIDIGLNMI